MSELDGDNAKSIDDDETDDIEEIQDEIDQEVQVAEQTDRSSLQTQLRAFFELFIIERNQLLLKIINDDENWDKTHGSNVSSNRNQVCEKGKGYKLLSSIGEFDQLCSERSRLHLSENCGIL